MMERIKEGRYLISMDLKSNEIRTPIVRREIAWLTLLSGETSTA